MKSISYYFCSRFQYKNWSFSIACVCTFYACVSKQRFTDNNRPISLVHSDIIYGKVSYVHLLENVCWMHFSADSPTSSFVLLYTFVVPNFVYLSNFSFAKTLFFAFTTTLTHKCRFIALLKKTARKCSLI